MRLKMLWWWALRLYSTFGAPAELLEFHGTRRCRVFEARRAVPRFLSMPRQFVRRAGQSPSREQRRCTPETTNMENESSSLVLLIPQFEELSQWRVAHPRWM